MSEQLSGVDMASGRDWQSSVIQAKPFDLATAKVGDEVLVRAKITTFDPDCPVGVPVQVATEAGDELWCTLADISGVIPAPEPPRRPDGWSADGRSLDYWHGVSPEERERRCEVARRAVEEAHRPNASGWRFTSAIGGGCFGFHASGRGFYYGLGTAWYDRPNPSTFDDAVGGSRHEITAAEAYDICKANGQGAKFREITWYKP